MQVTQISLGRFHHFHLARQLERHGLLGTIWTGYPRFKLKDENGIAPDRIRTFPWTQTILMGKGALGLPATPRLDDELVWLGQTLLDRHVSRRLESPTALIALSGGGLESGRAAKKAGGVYYCDRGSSHIRYQDRILRDEYARWGIAFRGVDPRMIEREEREYELADTISVPSIFVAKSFVEMGVPRDKLFVNPYGARLERFRPVGTPAPDRFDVLFVGGVSIRKGFLYLLEAFARLRHPRKRLRVIGAVSPEIRSLLAARDLSDVEFLGTVGNEQLAMYYSTSQVMVLPSIEEGFGMVIGEALACGCPVIASENTGGIDFFTDGVEGLIVPPRSSEALLAAFEKLAGDETLRSDMSRAAVEGVKKIGGWDRYGECWVTRLERDAKGLLSADS